MILIHPPNHNDSEVGQVSFPESPSVTPTSFSWQEQC